MNFQDMIATLTHFWAKQGCAVHQGYDLEVGAGTFNPATFLRCLGPEPYSAVYVEPSRRPKDGRYGDNPNRTQFYHQMQVIIKPSPANIQELYLKSLEAVGFKIKEHDIRFVHDDWENPTIGAWGLGWEVWCDGMEITQFTYFQAVGGLPVKPVSGEITYGLERLAMYVQGVDSFFDLKWNEELTYGDIFKRNEWEWSHYNFSEADASMWFRHFDDFEKEALRMIERNLPIPGYDFVMKASHAFNILDARGVISVTERTGYMARIRALAKQLAENYIQSREKMGFPLLPKTPPQEKKTQEVATSSFNPSETQDFLLEVGSEELPATFVPLGLHHLERLVQKFLQEHQLSFTSIHSFATPRRLAVMIKDLAMGTSSYTEEKKGPSIAAAFDAQGHLTPVGAGFFRSMNLSQMTKQEIEEGKCSSISFQDVKGVLYLFVKKEIAGLSTRQMLQTHLPQLILNIEFPKKMRWGNSDLEYARPLRWIVALFGSEVISFELGDVQSGHTTYGHSQIDPRPIILTHPSEYLSKLKEHYVLASIEERKQAIEDQLKVIEEKTQGQIAAKDKVMPQVLHLVEWPELIVGNFDPRYLEAPKEVLISEMVEHQKYFPIVSKDGSLQPHFVIVSNNHPTEKIQKGNEKALTPRLADGLYLYQQDLKVPLIEWNEKLKKITFQKDLGSIFGKVERIISNAKTLGNYLQIDKALEAGVLCKADLATALVGEFPELQGVAGCLFALKEGKDQDVARAIDEHWMPKGEKGALPKTPSGIALCLAEKLDNFVSYFSLGLQPTSSSDPYALRRGAFGFIKIIIENKLKLPLNTLLEESFSHLVNHPEVSAKAKKEALEKKTTILKEIKDFLFQRFKTLLLDEHFQKDEIEAAFAKDSNDLYSTYCLLQQLQTFRRTSHEAFLKLLEMHHRVKKILGSHDYKEPSLQYFQKPVERNLLEKLQLLEQEIPSQLPSGERDYEKEFRLLSELHAPLDTLFNEVKIMDEDQNVRLSRLGLLNKTLLLCDALVDLEKIQEHDTH